MIYYIKIIKLFIRASIQNEFAYRVNFWISLFHSFLNLGTGILGLVILFRQVETLRGWDFASTLAILGVYLIIGSLRGLFIGPSLESMAGMDGDVWRGKLDFTLLRPLDVQFQASFRNWKPMALIDLLFGLGVLVAAVGQFDKAIPIWQAVVFFISLVFSVTTLYAILLAFAGLVFWSPGFLFTWIFDSVFQMARYPVGIYPSWLRFFMTWIIPVGVITTIPAQTLSAELEPILFIGAGILSLLFFLAASILFRTGLRRYASASS